MSRSLRNITGTFDILPTVTSTDAAHEDSMWTWQVVESSVAEIMRLYAFNEIRTPILEPTELIARGVGQFTDIVSKEMYSFERDETSYVLRPEMTAPVMRAYIQHHLSQQGGVQKLYYMGPCFRAERPQKGRYRQFHQFGCEVIGANSVFADVEVISVMMRIYASFGIENMSLRINTLGDENTRPSYREALTTYFQPYMGDLSEVSKVRLEKNPLRILDTKNEKERTLLAEAPKLIDYIDNESREDYEQLKSLLSELEITFVEDPYLVRGLDYYTRTAFELESDALGAQNVLAGGGRYDLLATEIGSKTPIPAIGFAAGVERLLIALRAIGAKLPPEPHPVVFIVGLGEAAQVWALSFAQRLRKLGISVNTDLKGRSMKAQMREANRSNVDHVVIVGDHELSSQKAAVKNMAEGTQDDISFDALEAYFTTGEGSPLPS